MVEQHSDREAPLGTAAAGGTKQFAMLLAPSARFVAIAMQRVSTTARGHASGMLGVRFLHGRPFRQRIGFRIELSRCFRPSRDEREGRFLPAAPSCSSRDAHDIAAGPIQIERRRGHRGVAGMVPDRHLGIGPADHDHRCSAVLGQRLDRHASVERVGDVAVAQGVDVVDGSSRAAATAAAIGRRCRLAVQGRPSAVRNSGSPIARTLTNRANIAAPPASRWMMRGPVLPRTDRVRCFGLKSLTLAEVDSPAGRRCRLQRPPDRAVRAGRHPPAVVSRHWSGELAGPRPRP